MNTETKINKVTPEQHTEVCKKLRRGDSQLIAEILGGLYTKETVWAMINGKRTMKPVVYHAAIKLTETIENLKNEVTL